MNELALGAIVVTIAAVPLALLLLIGTELLRVPDPLRRARWIRACLVALALPAGLLLGVAVWGWAGAAHLGPLCYAYATPEYRATTPRRIASLVVDSDQGPAPGWAAALYAPGGPAGTAGAAAAAAGRTAGGDLPAAALRLVARRRTHHENRWFKVEMDRFTLRDLAHGAVLAEADEIWIRAGLSTYHCGVGSGLNPTADSDWPAGDGVARFVAQALQGAPPG